jgi:hypothetical protein
MSNLIRPDHSEGTGQLAEAASGALFHIKSRALSLFMQSSAKAGYGAVCFLTMMAE